MSVAIHPNIHHSIKAWLWMNLLRREISHIRMACYHNLLRMSCLQAASLFDVAIRLVFFFLNLQFYTTSPIYQTVVQLWAIVNEQEEQRLLCSELDESAKKGISRAVFQTVKNLAKSFKPRFVATRDNADKMLTEPGQVCHIPGQVCHIYVKGIL